MPVIILEIGRQNKKRKISKADHQTVTNMRTPLNTQYSRSIDMNTNFIGENGGTVGCDQEQLNCVKCLTENSDRGELCKKFIDSLNECINGPRKQ